MTDSEIIKALECYRNSKIIQVENGVVSIGDVLDLINRQKEQVDYWKRNAFDGCMERCRIEKEARAEAIKEFADRLKEKSCKLQMVSGDVVLKRDFQISEDTIDNLVKEMVGEQ